MRCQSLSTVVCGDQPTGMSLRDWFAGQALAGLLLWNNDVTMQDMARTAYIFADAMLTVREKEKP